MARRVPNFRLGSRIDTAIRWNIKRKARECCQIVTPISRPARDLGRAVADAAL
jgi:hypothetical protein